MSSERAKLLRLARAKAPVTTSSNSLTRVVRTAPCQRTVYCDSCGTYGDHVAAVCPEKNKQGVPEGLRKRVRASNREDDVPTHGLAEDAKDAQDGTDATAGGPPSAEAPVLILESALLNGSYCDLPPDFLRGEELEVLVSRRPDAPSFLRCHACLVLPSEPVWCSCCDVLACKSCVEDPLDDASRQAAPFRSSYGVCPACSGAFGSGDDDRPAAHAVGALRSVICAWKRCVMEATDPYARQACYYANKT